MEEPPIEDIKQSRSLEIVRHTKIAKSEVDILQIEDDYPELWEAVTEIYNAHLVIPRANGIFLAQAVFTGLRRRGPKYIDWKLEQDKIEISHKAMQILQLVARYQQFITWDRLLLYLKTHNWGDLQPDTSKTETKAANPPDWDRPIIEKRDVEWLNSDERKRALERPPERR